MIYLDNAATTKICEKAVKAMEPYLKRRIWQSVRNLFHREKDKGAG